MTRWCCWNALAAELPGLAAGPATLRIAVNADSLATWVIPALAATQGFFFDLVIDDQDVSQDWLRRGEVAAAITAHPGPLQGCDTAPLGRCATAPPLRPPISPAGLPRASRRGPGPRPGLTFSDKDKLQTAGSRRRGRRPPRHCRPIGWPRPRLSSMPALRALAGG
jgi:LysR family transcriptional regulator, chromosome initiation inhibitor